MHVPNRVFRPLPACLVNPSLVVREGASNGPRFGARFFFVFFFFYICMYGMTFSLTFLLAQLVQDTETVSLSLKIFFFLYGISFFFFFFFFQTQIERGEGDTKQQAWQIPTEKKWYLPAREKSLRFLARRQTSCGRYHFFSVGICHACCFVSPSPLSTWVIRRAFRGGADPLARVVLYLVTSNLKGNKLLKSFF